MVFVYTTCAKKEEADTLGKLVIGKKLAACVNMWPIESCYMWEGSMKCEQEHAVLIKTLESKLQPIEDLILRNHTYSTPFVGAVDIRRINREYKEWMAQVIE
ncbi:MAG: divalent-cation tolerance protein CutA [Patescibacteria group bacterium]